MTHFEPDPENRREYQGVTRDSLVDSMEWNPHLPNPGHKNEMIKLDVCVVTGTSTRYLRGEYVERWDLASSQEVSIAMEDFIDRQLAGGLRFLLQHKYSSSRRWMDLDEIKQLRPADELLVYRDIEADNLWYPGGAVDEIKVKAFWIKPGNEAGYWGKSPTNYGVRVTEGGNPWYQSTGYEGDPETDVFYVDDNLAYYIQYYGNIYDQILWKVNGEYVMETLDLLIALRKTPGGEFDMGHGQGNDPGVLAEHQGLHDGWVAEKAVQDGMGSGIDPAELATKEDLDAQTKVILDAIDGK